MKRVRLIRYGESAANVGLATQDHAGIPLTPRWYEQALDVALTCWPGSAPWRSR